MRRVVCLLAMALPVLAAVDGTVTNATTGKPQAGATVTLYENTQAGPEPLESVKSGADGSWKIDKPFQGMGFIQTAFDGVTYNHTLRPNAPKTGISLAVYNVTAKMGAEVKVTNHMLLLEPQGDKLSVRESYFFANEGKTTWNDGANGTLRFLISKEPLGPVEVNATAPQGMPVARLANKGKNPGEMKVDFPIKPGETRIDLAYTLPYASPSRFQTKFLLPAMQAMIAVPNGVEVKGEGLKEEGKEPTTQASIFKVETQNLDLTLTGTGELTGAGAAGDAGASSGPEIEQIPARPYEKLYWVLGLLFAILGCGFVLLYRSEARK
ncbi:MAG: hypothetical protein JNM66_31465 [Bryobacterales bacterium]|nr:hypothetical protein [Bryobacterales bacterium]